MAATELPGSAASSWNPGCAGVLEVFTGGGEVLTTRVYRGGVDEDCSGVQLVSWGEDSKVLSAGMYEMGEGVHHA
ncbi:MAG: hypothetical protein WDW38_008021 [Sanguina aurantia]